MDPSVELVKSTKDRFLSHTKPVGDCIEWTASLRVRGYGQFNAGWDGDRKWIGQAHRFAWILENGPIPKGMLVCHKCDNRRCVKPDHLFIGTYTDNNRDMFAKGRGYVFDGTQALGTKNVNAKLNPHKVAEIRRRLAAGERGIDVARAFGISPATISSIRLGQTWKIRHLTPDEVRAAKQGPAAEQMEKAK